MKIPRWRSRGYHYLPDLLRGRNQILEFVKENISNLLGLSGAAERGAIIIEHSANRLSRSVNVWLQETGNNESQLNIDRNVSDEVSTISPAGIIPGHFNWVEDFAKTGFKYFDPNTTSNADAACGIILKWGGGTTVAGKIYHLNTSGNWALTDGTVATSGTALVAFAMGTDPDVHGMLLKGYARVGTYSHGSPWNPGVPVYISDKTLTDGTMSDTIPTASGSVIRVMGFCLSGNTSGAERVMWFDPDGSYTTA
tara:strand:- start:37 stop:795 length:759 start_codon:yes stop_codon:yes gene_type:complete